MLMALPGCVYAYQGEELGLYEVEDLKHEDLQDPNWIRNIVVERKRVYFKKEGRYVNGVAVLHTEKGRDGCRVPLPWKSTGTSFGFGTGKAHLPQPQWFKDFSVESESKDATSTLAMYRTALALRKKLQTSEDLEWVKTSDPEVVHFVREGGWHCITNFRGKDYKLPVGKVLVSSGPLKAGKLPAATSVWIKVA